MKRRVLPLLLIVGMLGVLGAAAADETGGADQSGATNPFAGNADAAKSGRQVFLQTGCYNCHGLDAKGGGIAPDLRRDLESDHLSAVPATGWIVALIAQ